ncbi:MAG: cupin domain-containing protein [Chloroflexota bacterium]
MLKVGDVLDMGPFQIKLTVKELTEAVLGVELELGPRSGGTPIHIHPHALETYEVLEGRFEAYVDGVWRTYQAGEEFEVPRGVPHTFRNSSGAKARIYHTHQPALKMAQYFEGLHKIAHSGVTKNGEVTFKAIMYLSLLMMSFKDEIIPINPPAPVANVLGFFGKLAGYRI